MLSLMVPPPLVLRVRQAALPLPHRRWVVLKMRALLRLGRLERIVC